MTPPSKDELLVLAFLDLRPLVDRHISGSPSRFLRGSLTGLGGAGLVSLDDGVWTLTADGRAMLTVQEVMGS